MRVIKQDFTAKEPLRSMQASMEHKCRLLVTLLIASGIHHVLSRYPLAILNTL